MTPITLALSGAASYPRACMALSAMLSRNALNPADITVVRLNIIHQLKKYIQYLIFVQLFVYSKCIFGII